ncbi:MAG: hypothetical protein SFZ02_18855 [bacterium]|nr:hypothetical protein [bacterium]
MRLKWVMALIILCLSIGVFGSSAQDREANRPYVTFTAGTRSNNLIYYTPDLPDYPHLIRIINESITAFNTMTPNPWDIQIVAVFMGVELANTPLIGSLTDPSLTYVTRREPRNLFDPQVCLLRVFNGWDSDDDIESQVAKTLFLCLQTKLVGSEGVVRDISNFWAYGALRDWAAYKAFPKQFPKGYHALFDQRRDVTTARLENFYFWMFAESSLGYGSAQNVITEMINGYSNFPATYGNSQTDVFHNWAKMLISYKLPLPPTLQLNNIGLNAGKGGSTVVNLLPRSADYRSLAGFQVEPGNVAFIKVGNLTNGNYGVSIRLNGVFKRLSEGAPFQFCPNQPYDMLVFSRGVGAKGSPVPLTVEWGQVESSKPCKPKEEAQNTGNPNQCIVGSWQVTASPFDQMNRAGASVDTSRFIFTFSANGTFTGNYDITANDTGNILHVNMPFTGTYAISRGATENNDTRYNVTAFTWTMQPGGRVTFTATNGAVTDLTKQYYADTNYTPFGPNRVLTCTDTTLSWTTSAGIGDFTLTRMPEA